MQLTNAEITYLLDCMEAHDLEGHFNDTHKFTKDGYDAEKALKAKLKSALVADQQ